MESQDYSIAVLPFVNMSSDPENEYFSDGISEEIINALTKIQGLQVTARTSSFAFKGKCEDIREIGRQLDVSTILEGSVRKAGCQVRITAQLINVEDGYHYWSETYDRQLEDIFAIQDEISIKIAEKLREHLGHFNIQERLIDRPTQNLEAYQLYLKGKFYGHKWSPEHFCTAIDLYEQSIQLAPDFALAYAGLADAYTTMAALNIMPGEEGFNKARVYAQKALSFNDQLAECHIALSNIYFWSDWQFGKAIDELEQALQLSPGNAEALGFMGLFLAFSQEVEEGKRLLDKSLKADPYCIPLQFARTAVFIMEEDFDGAIRQGEYLLQLNPNFLQANGIIGYSHFQLGHYQEALNWFQSMPLPNGAPYTDHGWLACCYQKLGQTALAKSHMAQQDAALGTALESPCMYATKALYAIHEEQYEEAVQHLKEGIDKQFTDFVWLDKDPSYKALHDLPSFQSLSQYLVEKRARHTSTIEGPKKYASSNLSYQEAESINMQLLTYMEEYEPYLDNQLSLRQLADQLKVNTNYLSQVINEKHEKNFFEFINSYRVNALKQKMKNPKNRQFTLLSLAYECGFNSKTTFNTTFKKLTGLTPSQYLKKVG